jgi:hypothetical protein
MRRDEFNTNYIFIFLSYSCIFLSMKNAGAGAKYLICQVATRI